MVWSVWGPHEALAWRVQRPRPPVEKPQAESSKEQRRGAQQGPGRRATSSSAMLPRYPSRRPSNSSCGADGGQQLGPHLAHRAHTRGLTWYLPASGGWWRVAQASCQRLPWVPDRNHKCVSASPSRLMARRRVPRGRGLGGDEALTPALQPLPGSPGGKRQDQGPLSLRPCPAGGLTDLGTVEVEPEGETLPRGCGRLGLGEQVGSGAPGGRVRGIQEHEVACGGTRGWAAEAPGCRRSAPRLCPGSRGPAAAPGHPASPWPVVWSYLGPWLPTRCHWASVKWPLCQPQVPRSKLQETSGAGRGGSVPPTPLLSPERVGETGSGRGVSQELLQEAWVGGQAPGGST